MKDVEQEPMVTKATKAKRRSATPPDPNSDGSEFDAREWPFFWLTHATGLYLSRLERGLKKVGLDIGRWRVLMCVQPGQALSVSEISELAIVKLPTMMKLIQRMEAEGLVSCEARATDGRVTDVSLTKDGLAARTRAWQTAGKIFSRVFTGDEGMDFDALNRQLRQVVVRLEDD
ncbi:MarR family winged helix-turn-helix transcriptional regulator [Novosphingobium kaempferiae]|uniref:MarR family winged helix-turn-helix transcriptional regulator n=1 Tax=Novosphingobium kaempferiae TaxID=2896849 RepID=UPI001E4BCFFD|nr:MarR family winged helix-turn-helix transcriptional regulator [Novosphingobium kaempferiae]